ncbi:hypothetical protein YG5714_3006 [Sulfolobus islandicus Y.G.57.14]|uniref:Uncharacterized protein n=4 Tax=Saccharolobus islandicus TaxID=43080 RepID=M9U885_SACIS|nr:hypothetical protein YG5714_3006 [Sulfolobus islandicus Y.G.57.14]ADX83206.1 hypothetical protein SiH_1858 [Sulfolobus islandicus HVE10/4]ADX85842.1 hypothetical protein SiRe_1778 [Sulfolobus islandicus REY15A]AGJ63219.1 Hypothetical Protein SiL_1773 [Sulfolobus islandicus LAL14/1]
MLFLILEHDLVHPKRHMIRRKKILNIMSYFMNLDEKVKVIP